MFDGFLSESQSRTDKLQIAAICALMLLGCACVYSATMVTESANSAPWYNQIWVRQVFWYVVGLGAATTVCLINYHTLARWALVLYWANVLLLALVLVAGTVRFGARRWFDLGFFSLQPSEFAKLAFILAQAHFLSRPEEEVRSPAIFWQSIGLMILPFLLIMKEPDLGSALVLLPTGLAMLYAAGTPRRYLVQLLTVVGLCGGVFAADVLFAPPGWQIKMQDYQRRRPLVFFGM